MILTTCWQAEYSFRGVASRFVSMINQFGRKCGFRAIRDEILSRKASPSLARIRALLAPLQEIKEFLTAEFLGWFMDIRHRVREQVLSLSDEALKNDFKNAQEVVQLVCQLHLCTLNPDISFKDQLKLDFALKGFTSPFLERRLAGLLDITEFIEHIEQLGAEQCMERDSSSRKGDEPLWVTADYLCDWLMQHEILDCIFARNVHYEILKRCNRLLVFLSTHDRVGEREAALIWEASMGKHESVQKVVHELLCDTVHSQKVKVLRTLMRLIEPLRPQDYTAQHVELLRAICVRLIQLGVEQHSEHQFAGLELFWRLLHDDVRFSQQDLHFSCLNYFTQALLRNECRSQRSHYFALCVENLRQHRAVPQSLIIISKLIMTVGAKRKHPEVDWSTYNCLRDEQELLELVIHDVVWFQNKCAEAWSTLATTNPKEFDFELLDGIYSRQTHLERRVEFLLSVFEMPVSHEACHICAGMCGPHISMSHAFQRSCPNASADQIYVSRVHGFTFCFLMEKSAHVSLLLRNKCNCLLCTGCTRAYSRKRNRKAPSTIPFLIDKPLQLFLS